MKETFIRIIRDVYELSNIKTVVGILPEATNHLIIAAQLWFITLSLYFSVIFTTSFLFILTGREDFLNSISDFTIAYFYDGMFLGFIAWRIHLAIYFFCLLLTFND